jgi:hypothetical protein
MTDQTAFTFSGDVYDGETCTIERDGFTLTATIHADHDSGAPWDEEDGHGEVSGWRPYGDNQHPTKAPGERVIARDGRSARFYDFAGAVAKAKAEGWDVEPYGTGTPGERAVRAAEADFAHLKAWCDDQWFYVGVAVTVAKAGVDLTGPYDHAIWGTESTAGEHMADLANDRIGDALDAARAKASAIAQALEA